MNLLNSKREPQIKVEDENRQEVCAEKSKRDDKKGGNMKSRSYCLSQDECEMKAQERENRAKRRGEMKRITSPLTK